MPRVNQVGRGRAAGSIIRYPSGTAALAIEIHRLLSVKKKLNFVGWQLWMQGYQVAEEYWKPAINSALSNLKHIPAWLRTMERNNQNENETIFDQVPTLQFRNSPFAKGLAKLPPDMKAFSFGFLADVAKGTFERHQTASRMEQTQNRQTISKFVGQSFKQTVAGILPKADFEIDLEIQLEALSHAIDKIQRHPYSVLVEITPQARIEFSTLLHLAAQLNLIIPTFEKSSIGRFTKAIVQDQIVQAHLVIIWCIFRKMGTILDSAKIAEIASNLGSKSTH